MFSLFKGGGKGVKQLRSEFEEIRRLIIEDLNGYYQFCFGSIYKEILGDTQGQFDIAAARGGEDWQKLAEQIRAEAAEVEKLAKNSEGIGAEEGVVGGQAILLLAIKAGANAHGTDDAAALREDIARFELKVFQFMQSRKNILDKMTDDD